MDWCLKAIAYRLLWLVRETAAVVVISCIKGIRIEYSCGSTHKCRHKTAQKKHIQWDMPWKWIMKCTCINLKDMSLIVKVYVYYSRCIQPMTKLYDMFVVVCRRPWSKRGIWQKWSVAGENTDCLFFSKERAILSLTSFPLFSSFG